MIDDQIPQYWYWFSMALVVVEVLAGGIGFLFAALGAFCTALLIQNGMVHPADFLTQWASFFGLTCVWAALLWKPMKNFRMRRNAPPHHDVIGRMATVGSGGIVKHKTGEAKWSGTIMKARLAEDASMDAASEGDHLKIVELEGVTLILAQKDYPITANEEHQKP